MSHHWLTTLFSMVAAWAGLVTVEHAQRYLRWPRLRGLRWPLIADAAAGMAAMVTPHRGVLIILAIVTAFLILRRHRAEVVIYVLGCSLVPVGLLAYLIWNQSLAAAFNDVILFAATRYAPIQSVPFGSVGDWGFGPLKYLFPLAALLTFPVCARDWRSCLRDRLLWSCAAFALAGFVGCFPRPDIIHIAFAAPLACPLLAICLTRLAQRWQPTWRRYGSIVVFAGVVIWLAISSGVYFLRISREALRGKIVQTPRGEVAPLSARVPELLVARIAATPSGDLYCRRGHLSCAAAVRASATQSVPA